MANGAIVISDPASWRHVGFNDESNRNTTQSQPFHSVELMGFQQKIRTKATMNLLMYYDDTIKKNPPQATKHPKKRIKNPIPRIQDTIFRPRS